MPNQRLTWMLNVNSAGAVSALNAVGTAGQAAARDVEEGFDRAGTNSENALRALTAEMDSIAAEADQTRAAVAAIGENLSVDIDDSTVTRFVQNLRSKFGVAFDDITADAKQFADVLERGVDMGPTIAEIRGVGTALDGARSEADQSRSVLANLAGNTAQDLGELGGVVGSLGVGIGQLAEYAVDGNIGLANLAKMAGPMAALALGGMAVSKAFESLGAKSKLADETTEATTQAMLDASAATDQLEHNLQVLMEQAVLSGDAVAQVGAAVLQGLADEDNTAEIAKINTALETLGMTAEDLGPTLVAMGTDTQEATFELGELMGNFDDVRPKVAGLSAILRDQGFGEWSDSMAFAIETGDDLTTITNNLASALYAQGYASDVAAVQAENLVANHREQIEAIEQLDDVAENNRLNQFATAQLDLAAAADLTSAALIAEIEAASPDLSEFAVWLEFNRRQKELGATTTDTTKTVAEAADALRYHVEQMNRDTEAYQENKAAAEAARDANERLALTMASDRFDVAGIEAATDALAEWFNTTVAGGTSENIIFQYQDALDSFTESVVASGGLIDGVLAGAFTAKTPEAREQLHILEQLGETVMPRITEAYDEADGSFDSFNRSVSAISDSIHRDLVASLIESGVEAADAEDQANSLQMALGLIPGNVATMYELMGDADATAKLALLQGVIDDLPTDVQTEVALHILADDPQAALAAVQTHLNSSSVSAPMHLNTAPAFNDYYNLAGVVDNPITVPVWLHIANQAAIGAIAGAIGGFSAPAAAAPAAAPMAAAAPAVSAPAAATAVAPFAPAPRHIEIKLSAAMLPNRYDVQRAVTAALVDAQRLGRL